MESLINRENSLYQRVEMLAEQILPTDLIKPQVLSLIILSLQEDLFANDTLPIDHLEKGDVTSQFTLSEKSLLWGKITAKQDGVIAGLPIAALIFALLSPDLRLSQVVEDGNKVSAGQEVGVVIGPGQAMLAAERTALNFLGRLSGTASLTHKYVEAVKGTRAVILDTRKTAPGFRLLDKYAVRMGGGQNHRMGLYDMVLIKDNHIDGAGGIPEAVNRVRSQVSAEMQIEVEVKNLDELRMALELPIQRIMLDNMNLSEMREAVLITNGKIPLEASGNVNLSTIREIAETGVDYISVGALTHSAPVLDLSMRLSAVMTKA